MKGFIGRTGKGVMKVHVHVSGLCQQSHGARCGAFMTPGEATVPIPGCNCLGSDTPGIMVLMLVGHERKRREDGAIP